MAVYANVPSARARNFVGRPERRPAVCPFALSLAIRMTDAQMGRATPLSADIRGGFMIVRPALIRPEWIRVRRRAALAAAGAGLAAVAVAGCTGGTPSSVFTPTPQISTSSHSGTASTTPSPSRSATAKASVTVTATATKTRTAKPTTSPVVTHRPTATATATATPTPTATATHRATHAATPPATEFPVGAPQTGGGGTAGLQDVTLFGIGGLAILSGIGSLAYRRRLTRKRRAQHDTTPSTPTHAGTR
jgi:hypothetical protein